jgi:hypothetical protein
VSRSRLSNARNSRRCLVPGCACVVLLLPSLVTGCKARRDIAPVSGVITLDGRPLAGGSIVCQPIAPPGSVIAGKGSGAFCDANGHFELQTLSGQPGAVVGEHRVRIYGARTKPKQASNVDGGSSNDRELVPKKYNRDTTLTLTVPPEGTTEANFTLTSK